MTILKPNRNCWRVAHAQTCSVLIDAENYFRALRADMLAARERIILIGWDFDARVKMYDTQGEVEGPLEIGAYIDWLVERNPALEVFILHWDIGALKLLSRGRTLAKLVRWTVHPRIHVKLDNEHPSNAALHEKIVVIDRSHAFCGGIDITEDRWDTRAHRDDEDRRKQPNNNDAGPWHDAAVRLTGPVATDLSDLAEERWEKATGSAPTSVGELLASGKRMLDGELAEETLSLTDVKVAIARTRGQTPNQVEVREIEALACDIIECSERYLCIENQYLTSKKIAAALAKTLSAASGPEIVLVLPASADGWLEPTVMDSTRAHLIEALRTIDEGGRLRVYHPVTSAGSDIYVHAKILIADDRFLRIGSSNLSNRSMGFDSECDVCVDATQASAPAIVARTIADVLNDLLAEHLGCRRADVAQRIEAAGSLIAAIDGSDRSRRNLRAYQAPDLNDMESWFAKNDILDPYSGEDDWEEFAHDKG